MPVVFRYKGCRFFFFSNEGNPQEPLHIHVRRGDCLAKIWLSPLLRVEESFGFTSTELRDLLAIVEQNYGEIERSWNEHFGC